MNVKSAVTAKYSFTGTKQWVFVLFIIHGQIICVEISTQDKDKGIKSFYRSEQDLRVPGG